MQTNLRLHQKEGPLVIARGEGCRVFDDSGREYIDTVAGLWCASLGFGSERLARGAYEQMRRLGYYPLFPPPPPPPPIEPPHGLAQNAPGATAPARFPCSGPAADDTRV